jgi:2-phosphosulfolactate phosphatase
VKIHVYSNKEEIKVDDLQNATAVVIDVLLATTTLVTIMENGASHVYTADTVSEAKWIANLLEEKEVITGGESHGRFIDGFTCGPLPEEFSSDKVNGKNVVYVSTNGTRAMRTAENAKELLLANIRNVNAVVRYLQKTRSDELYIICSGAQHGLCLEDFLCAGIIIQNFNMPDAHMNDAAKLALYIAQTASIGDFIARSSVGVWLMENGFEQTLRFVGEVGASDTVVAIRNRMLEIVS